jgi:hypothetical protein
MQNSNHGGTEITKDTGLACPKRGRKTRSPLDEWLLPNWDAFGLHFSVVSVFSVVKILHRYG